MSITAHAFLRPFALLSALVALGADAQAASCSIYPTNTCTAAQATVSATSSTSLAKVAMTGFQRLDVFAKVCSPTGWFLHMADSPTADGYGGDSGTTDHDAEAWLAMSSGYPYLGYFGSYDYARADYADSTYLHRVINDDYADASGCHVIRMAFLNAATTADPSTTELDVDALNAYGYLPAIKHADLWGPRLGYAAATSSTDTARSVQKDYEDAALKDSYYWYVGVNRTYGSASRAGTGVKAACIVTSTTTATTPSSCL